MTTVVLPSLTDQMILGVFKYLVEAELRKNIPDQTAFRFGCQEGAIAVLELMFGSADDQTAETAYNNCQSWTHVICDIKDDLKDWAVMMEDAGIDDIEGLQDAVEEAVNKYALKHPQKIGDALRVL